MKETELYTPIKQYLEGQGYEVKAEIASADLVAMRGDEPPLVIELKTGFALTLFHQAIERQAITELVYVAVPRGKGKPFLKSLKRNQRLCRRLGLGLITVRLRDSFVEVHADPGPYQPRRSKVRKARLLREFTKRRGDPNIGGTNSGIVTAYRQDALRCAQYLETHGPTKASVVAAGCEVPNARNIMADNHYNWFIRVSKGIYDLDPESGADFSEPGVQQHTANT